MATDMVGGFDAWKVAGLPVRALDESRSEGRGDLPGMGPSELLLGP